MIKSSVILHFLFPNLFQSWFDRGYERGIAAQTRKETTLKQELGKAHSKIEKLGQVISQLEHRNDKKKDKKHRIVPLNKLPRYKKNQKTYYVPSLDSQKIVKDSKFCVYCGCKAQTADHLTPKSRGGSDGYANLAPACYSCNQEKGNMTYDEYVTWRRYHYTELYNNE